jgi:tetratricopeptide (TPR) repeat protein
VGVTEVSRWNVPYPRNPFFTGREELLARLSTVLQTMPAAALTQPQAISGLGGIGKTQIAIEYVYRSHADYQAVFWARADTHENMISDYVSIAELLQLPEKDAQDQMLAVHAVKKWLSTHEKWLLILDSADELTMVREFLPLRHTGHLLLTTRAPAMGQVAQRIEVEQMEEEVGALFLLRRVSLLSPDLSLEQAVPGDREAAYELTRELDGLPLALDQAGAYIEETPSSVQDYLRLYRQQRGALLARRGGRLADHPESVGTTWSLSFEQIRHLHPSAADLLRVCAFLHHDAIPEALFTSGGSHLGPLLRVIATDEIAFDKAVSALYAYSLVHRDLRNKTLSLHRLVQDVLKHEMSKKTQRMWTKRVVLALNAAFPEVEFTTWERCQAYLPHALVCDMLIRSHGLVLAEAASLLNRAGWYLDEHAQFAQAESLYQRALAIREKVLGPDHPDTSAILNNLGLLYRAQGRYKEAEPLYQRALAIYEQVFPPDHSKTAAILDNMAQLYRAQERYEEAEPLYQRALAIYEQVLPSNHSDISATLNNLGLLYQEQERYEEAEPLYQRALAIYEQALGPDHPRTASILNNLASLYQEQGRYEEAEPLYQRALAVKEKALGPDHPNVAVTLDGLAVLYLAQERYEEAEPLYQRALAIYEKSFLADHPNTAITLENYAVLLREVQRTEEATKLSQRAQIIRAKLFG